jgi:hypothetical protein
VADRISRLDRFAPQGALGERRCEFVHRVAKLFQLFDERPAYQGS